MKKKSFAAKGESMLGKRLNSLGEFLEDNNSESDKEINRETVNSEPREIAFQDNRINGKSKNAPVTERRFELKIPDNLAKQIIDHAFDRRVSKAAIVIEALQKYFHK